MSPDTVDALRHVGLTRVFRPCHLGGSTVDLFDYLRMLGQMALVDASAAWCLNIYNTSNWLVSGLLPDEALAKIHTTATDGVIAGSMVMGGPCRVQHMDDGYLLDGAWNFVSGCDYADWIFVKAPVATEFGQRPEHVLVLVSRSDCDLGADWEYSGLEGTGSKNIQIRQVFVSKDLVAPFSDHRLEHGVPAEHGRSLEHFRIPSRLIMRLPITAIALGVAKRALGLFEQNIGTKRRNGFVPSALPNFQTRFAESAMAVEHANALLHGAVVSITARVGRGDDFPPLVRARLGRDLVEAVHRCVHAVDLVMAVSGAQAGFSSHPMQQAFRDMHAISGHYSCDRDRALSNYAKVRLGLEIGDEVL